MPHCSLPASPALGSFTPQELESPSLAVAAPGNSPALGAPSQSCRSLVSPRTKTVAIPGAPRPHIAHSGSPTTALLNLCEELMFWGPRL